VRILVTGGLGVNGVVVTRQLIERGLRPVVVDLSDDFSLLPGWRAQIDFTAGDITDFDFVAGLFKQIRFDAVIHLAAYIAPDMNAQPFKSFLVNGQGTAYVLEGAHRAGVRRFIMASSRAVYGATPDNVGGPGYRPINEDFPKRPIKAYDVTKLAAEQLGAVYRDAFGLEFAALRFAGIYGPGKQMRHGKMALRSRIVEDPVAGRAVTVDRGGDQLDDMIYVEDAAAGLVQAALASRLNYCAYNIASGVGHSLREYADAVKAVLPDARIDLGPGANAMGFDVNRAAIFDISRARSDLGFEPRFDLRQGVADYIARLRIKRSDSTA
jgi:UDP-glucose 4-epimerase